MNVDVTWCRFDFRRPGTCLWTAYRGAVPTPVGPAPRDPNDPDQWDWSGDDRSSARRHPVQVVVAAAVIIILVMVFAARL